MDSVGSLRMSTSTMAAKAIIFILVSFVLASVMRAHPDFGWIAGFTTGAVCAWAIKPREPALWILALALVGLSILYMCIMHL
jgi:hypothetical protein